MFQGFWVCPFSSRPHCCSYYYRVFVFTCVLVPNCCTKVTLQFCFFILKWDLSGRFSPLYPLHLLLQFSNLPIYVSTDVLFFFLFPVLSGSNLSRYIVTLSGSGSARCFFFFSSVLHVTKMNRKGGLEAEGLSSWNVVGDLKVSAWRTNAGSDCKIYFGVIKRQNKQLNP